MRQTDSKVHMGGGRGEIKRARMAGKLQKIKIEVTAVEGGLPYQTLNHCKASIIKMV